MAFTHGKNTQIWLGGADLSGYFNSAEFSVDADTADTTTYGKNWKTHVLGAANATYDLGGFYDPTMTDVRSTIMAASGSVLTLGPAGLGSNAAFARLSRADTVTYAESAPVGDAVIFNLGLGTTADVGFGQVIQPLTTVTTSGSSAVYDNTTSSTNGAIGNLHVMSVSSADTITVVMEHSTNGSSWSSLQTFHVFSGAGAQRVEIAGTINRYTRCTWTVAGSGVSISFGVAFARL